MNKKSSDLSQFRLLCMIENRKLKEELSALFHEESSVSPVWTAQEILPGDFDAVLTDRTDEKTIGEIVRIHPGAPLAVFTEKGGGDFPAGTLLLEKSQAEKQMEILLWSLKRFTEQRYLHLHGSCDSVGFRKQTEGFFSMLEYMDFGIYIVDPDTYEIIAANEKAREFLGDDPIGKKCYNLLQKGSNTPCIGCNNKSLSRGCSDDPILPWEFKSDDRWYKRMSKVIPWPGKKYAKMEMIVDITETKRMERENINLRVFKEKAEDLPHVPVVVFGRKGKLTMMNAAASHLLDYGNDDLELMYVWNLLDENTKERVYNLTQHLGGADRVTIDGTITGKEKTVEAFLDIIFHRDLRGDFIEGTVFIIEKPKKIIRFY